MRKNIFLFILIFLGHFYKSNSQTIPSGSRLKDIPVCNFDGIGAFVPSLSDASATGIQRSTIAKNEFNFVEVGTWIPSIWSAPNTYNFDGFNSEVNWCVSNNKPAWAIWMFGNNFYTPGWFVNGTWTNAQLEIMVKNIIYSLLESNNNKTKVGTWCVLNEMLKGDGTYNPMLLNQLGWEADQSGLTGADKLNTQHPVFIRKVLQYFRDKTNAKLEIRDYIISNNISSYGWDKKCRAFYQLIKHLKATGAPIDVVSEQGHFDIGNVAWRLNNNEMGNNLRRLKDLGVEVYMPELDLGTNGATWDETESKLQKQIFHDIIVQAVNGGTSKIALWGINDGRDQGWRTDEHPLLWNNDYTYKPAYYGVQQALLELSKNICNLRTPENPTNAVSGLSYSYYQSTWNNLPDFSTLKAVKTDTISTFDISPRTLDTNFAFSYTGYVSIPKDGNYTFYTSSDDGSRLYIGSTLVVDNDGLHAIVEKSGTIGLKTGTHAITVNFFQKGGDKVLNLSYSSGEIAKQAIPASALFRLTTPSTFSGYYKLTAKHSGKVLDVDQSSTADGATVKQYTSNGTDAQKWLIEDVGEGYYSLKARCSGKALDVNGGPTATGNGVKVQQWTYGGGDNQKWKIDSVGGGYYKLTAKHSGKCLDISGGPSATGDGALANQWDYAGGDNQKWALTYISATGARESAATGKKVENTEPALNNFNVYPNPSNGIANISYTATHNEQIAIHLYDTQGRLVKTIFNGAALKGVEQNYRVDGSSLREGLYIIKLKTSSETINKKVIFDK